MEKKNVSSVGGGITQIKMSGDIPWDIDKIYDAANYFSGCVDFLIEEMQHRNYDTDLFIEALSVQEKAKQAASLAEKLRWHKMRKCGES